jgi:CRISPR/Cas system-associated exonuclease Cas4 (RecB family)
VSKGSVFLAPAGARDKKGPIFREIVSLYPEGDFSSVLYLSPNSFVLREAERDFFSYLMKNPKRTAYIPFRSFTLKQLAIKLHEACDKRGIVSDCVRPLLISEMLGGKNIGYADLLSGLLKKFRHYIPDKDLSQTRGEIGMQIFEEKAAERAREAISALEMYEDVLKKRGLVDSEDMLKNSITYIKEHVNAEHRVQSPQATRRGGSTEHRQQIKDLHLNPCPPSCFCKKAAGLESPNPFSYSTLVIDGFFDPTPLELKIIKTVMDIAGNVYVMVEEGAEFFNYLKENIKEITVKRLSRPVTRKSSGYFTFPSMEDEVEGIAKGIKDRILQGMKPWDIVVTFPRMPKYLPMLRRVFKKHGVPVSLAERELSNERPFMAIEDMISCLQNDYPRSDFLSFLASPHFPAVPSVVREWAVDYSFRAGIVKGKESWLNISNTLLNFAKEDLSGSSEDRFREFQKGIEGIIHLLEEISEQKSLSAFVETVESVLKRLGFFDSVSGDSDDISDELSAQLSELRSFAGLYVTDMHDINKPLLYLRTLLRDLKSFGRKRDGVRVVPFELLAGLEPDAIFIGGMTEDDFPSRPVIDPILPEKVKKSLGMPYLEYYLNRQRRYFRRLLNLSRFEPCFSCPSAEGDKLFLPSPLLDWEAVRRPLAMDINTEEDVLIMGGYAKNSGTVSGILWDNEPDFNKRALRILRGKIGNGNRGYLNVTDIDSYRKCPLRFYIEKVLRLQMDKPPRYEVESRLWGILAHKVMEYLFKEGDVGSEEMEERVFKGLKKGLEQFPIGDFWSRVAGEIFKRLLPQLKSQEEEIRVLGFSPYKVEVSLKTEAGSLRLKGKIDRVDSKIQDSRGQGVKGSGKKDKRHKTVILLDYKTGMADRDSLQLPLYAFMWQRNYAEDVQKTGVYSLRDGRVAWFPKRDSMEDYIQSAVKAADNIIKNIKEGVFSAGPYKEQECRYCYHSPLCNGSK